MSEYIDADFATICDKWQPTVTSGEGQKMSDDKTPWTGVKQLSELIKIVDAENGGRVIVIKGTKQRMSKEEIINKWQLLLDNYQTLELLFGYDKETLNAIAPDKELIEETIRLLKEQENEVDSYN